MKIKEIIEAWIIAGRPSKIQRELADKRADVCESCENKIQIIKGVKTSTVCSGCGCPVAKKIFTNIYDPCPLHKWAEIDKSYFTKQKDNKTLL
jgi:hypothetical protein